MTIKEEIEKLNVQIRGLYDEIKKLQDQCLHPKFVRGLTMVACVQSCYICEDCGFTKPMPIEDMTESTDKTYWEFNGSIFPLDGSAG